MTSYTPMEPGTKLRFTKDLGGVCSVNVGDEAVYLGYNRARITSGKSEGWVVCLTLSTPVEIFNKTPINSNDLLQI